MLAVMSTVDDVLWLLTRQPGLTEVEIARQLFGRDGYQQQVNSACRRLVKEYRIERRGSGRRGDPFTYHRKRIVRSSDVALGLLPTTLESPGPKTE
jgi:hypothetical protein